MSLMSSVNRRFLMIYHLVVFAWCLGDVQSWGGDSHRIVAKIASQFLRLSTKEYIRDHLGLSSIEQVDKHMIEESIWADTLTGSDDLHFSHTPLRDCQEFDFKRDCRGGRCVVSAITDFVSVATDPAASLEQRTEAIKFLIHLIADIHNPLHVGFEIDNGGTLIDVDYKGEGMTTLHEMWDNLLVGEKQREFPNAEGPWILSDHLMESISDKVSSGPYRLDLTVDHISSREAILKTVSDIASEISTQYTCRKAYENENKVFIEMNDLITPVYVDDRKLVAVELLKKAGIRLAEFLNTIVRLYKMRISAAKKLSAPAVPVAKKAEENIFMYLDFDFDEDELLYENDSSVLTTTEEVVDVVEDSQGVELEQEGEGETVQNAEGTKKKRKKKKKKTANRIEEFPVGGIENVVLIKRHGAYFVTSSLLVTASYVPFRLLTLNFEFSSGSLTLAFDGSVFGFDPSRDVVVRSLLEIRNRFFRTADESHIIPYDSNFLQLIEDDGASLSFTNTGIKKLEPAENTVYFENGSILSGDVDPMVLASLTAKMAVTEEAADLVAQTAEEKARDKKRAQRQRHKTNQALRKRFGGRLPSQQEVAEADLAENLPNICCYHRDRIYAFIHKDTMMDPTSPAIVTTRFIVQFSQMEAENFFLIDRKLLNGDTSESVVKILERAFQENTKLSLEMRKRRRTILDELDDLNVAIFGTDPGRFRNMKQVRYYTEETDPVSDLRMAAWSVHTSDRGLLWHELEHHKIEAEIVS
jgi:hypothetical protein